MFEMILIPNSTHRQVYDYDNRTPLHIAASTGDIEITKQLLWTKPNVNAKDRFGFSPLLEACNSRNDGVCKVLTEAGAKLNMSNEDQVRSVTIN